MSQSFRQVVGAALVVAALLVPWPLTSRSDAAIFAQRPGPIERPLSVVAADFDRDGRDDIVVANFQSGVLQVLIGRADGTFEPIASGPFGVGSATFSSATSGPFQQVVVDLNPDDVDADAVPNAADDCPNVYNPADTTGRQLDTEIAKGPDGLCGTADDNVALYGPDGLCDTADDLVGDGVGEACETGEDTNADGVVDVTVDTDGDGVPDYDPATLVLDNCPRLPNPGQEDAETAAGPDTLCGTADDNPGLFGPNGACGGGDDRIGDGVGDACAASPDLLILTTSQASGSSFGALRIRLNDGEGGLIGRASYLTGVGPGSMAVADFTGDTRPDVAITNTFTDLVEVLPGLADGEFGTLLLLTAGDGVVGSAAADVDGDGDKDLAVTNRAADTLSVFLKSASTLPTTASATPPTQTDGPSVVLAGDLDGNGSDDLVVLGQADTNQDTVADSGSIEVFLGATGAPPAPGQVVSLGSGHVPRAGLLRDLDGNGTLDLAVADFPARQVLLYAGAGDGTFAAAGSLATAGEPTCIVGIDLDPVAPGVSDLAVLQFNNRVDLFVHGGGFSFAAAPRTPASPWRDTSAMALFGADTLVGSDLVLLQRGSARLDLLSGIGDATFRPAPVQVIEGLTGTLPADAAVMHVADLRFDGRPDLAVLDPAAGKIAVLTNELTGRLVERVGSTVTPGAAGLASGTLLASITDIDRDGVPNDVDDCPTVYNPALCRVTDPACAVDILCDNAELAPITCDPAKPETLDPATGQCDSDQNGIGDHCQVLSENCANQDSDFDLVPDYDQTALARAGGMLDFDRDGVANTFDNCPTLSNLDQADVNENGVGDACETLVGGLPTDPDLDGVPTFDPGTLALDNCPSLPNPGQADNDGDGVGNTCVITAALDNCPATINVSQADANGDGVGDGCAVAPRDLLVANPATGDVDLLGGDGSGALHPAAASPLGPLPGPVAAVTGHFTLNCSLATLCFGRSDFDVAVATRATAGDPADDGVTVFRGDGAGFFSALPQAAAGGDPVSLLVAADQPVCALANDPARPNLRFDPDNKSDLLAVAEPGTPGIRVFLVSNQDVLDPAQSSLVSPVAHPAPLPVPAPLAGVLTLDANRDGVADLLALSSSPGGPSTLTLFIGIGNGLFFTDPTLNPPPVAAELALPVSGFIDIKTDNIFPDLALFSVTDEAPVTFFNVLRERSDIDGSGRVDGYDLAILAAAFGAERGEDFTLQADATFVQTGSGATRRLVGSGVRVPGQDLPDSAGFCSTAFQPLSGLYGLPVDINLDGVVDGEDLTYLASQFGRSQPR